MTTDEICSLSLSLSPFFQITINEIIRSKSNSDEHEVELKFFKCTISPLVRNIYKFIGVFLIGTASCQLLTDIGKYSVGRYRPHFLTVSAMLMSSFYYLRAVIIMFSCWDINWNYVEVANVVAFYEFQDDAN